MANKRNPYLDRIVEDPAILVGKPTVRGTRIGVEHVLRQLAVEPDFDALFAAYPHLSIEDVQAVLFYAYDAMARRGHRIAQKNLRSLPVPA